MDTVPEPLTFVAKASFKKGDVGWAVPSLGVLHPRDFRPAEHVGAYLVRACDDCRAGATAKFHASSG